ncbi:hypothetical protein UY3_09005 [Chelonia mydas]|uniref:Uncharacterized protein n=1 Tax=Chelonia mydas TaxID=8469 RepID=M7C006_CHEMY|nr:hypothetical protein UY3_09005 [Chelonia mydas]
MDLHCRCRNMYVMPLLMLATEGEPLLLVPEQHILLLHRSPLVPPVPSYNPAVEAWYRHQCPGPLLFGHTGHPEIPTKAAGTIGGLLSAIPLSVYEDEEEDVEPLPPVLPVLTAAASSPDEMLISSSLSPPDDHYSVPRLAPEGDNGLVDPVGGGPGHATSAMDILQPQGPSPVALPINEAILPQYKQYGTFLSPVSLHPR